MTLVLEIEYLAGVSYAAVGPDTDIPDWPPQPDRVFSALVATWAARGQKDDEASALKWLETLPVPRLRASEADRRTAPIVFVPPNDPRTGRQKNAAGVLPALRSRQPRRFPAARPRDPVVCLEWDVGEPDENKVATLQNLARDVTYIGHSASLVRCRFLKGGESRIEDAVIPKRRVYPGRFDELCREFDAGRRPLPGAPVIVAPPLREQPLTSVLGDRWLLLEHVASEMPDIRGSAVVAKTIRDAVLSGYRRIGCEKEIPEVVSGHAPDGIPTRLPHLAIVPLPFVGFPYADGHVMGFALVPPRESSLLDDDTFRKALRAIAPLDEDRGRRVMTIKSREGTPNNQAFRVDFSPTFEASVNKRSLDPAPYVATARTWATVTPIALDRHLKEKGGARQEEAAKQIVAACGNIGLPEPTAVVVDKHSAFEGAVSVLPSVSSPNWMRWRLPDSLASRQLTHAVIQFAEPVAGPVILGAGRFWGLGLCRRLH